MKKPIAMWAVIGISLVLAGCVVPSVYPFYTDKQVVFDPALVGAWVKSAKDDTNTWTFEKSGEKQYKLVIADVKPAVFSTHLFKLKSLIFMDCVPDQSISGDLSGIPSHYLLKISQIQPTLKWSTLNYQWMYEFTQKHPDAIRHTMGYYDPHDTNKMYVILTAPTRDLQKFILKHLDDTNAFVGLDEMKRASADQTH